MQPQGSGPEKQPPVEVTNQEVEHSLSRSSHALWRIANGIQNGLINRALVLGLLLLVGAALLISHFQLEAALALLRDTPPLAVLTGTLANVAPILIPVVGTAACSVGLLELSGDDARRGLNQLSLGLLAFLCALIFIDRTLVPPWLLLALAPATVVTFLFAIWERRASHRHGYKDSSADSARELLKLMVYLIVASFIIGDPTVRENLQRPYLPTEEIVIAEGTGENAEVGYVLGTSGGDKWTTIMLEADRSIQILETDSITHRALCTLDDGSSSRPWWPWFTSAEDGQIPDCE